MNTTLVEAEEQMVKEPSYIGAVGFKAKAALHQLSRSIRNLRGTRRYAKGKSLAQDRTLAESRTALFPVSAQAEAELVAGKVENLRRAVARINGVEIQANGEFSFWAQIGKPTSLRGFVKGRELREGCLIPSIGGGLCQLSNALYQCAVQSGFEITERHAHSQVIPGSSAEFGRDATVFWNYVDLRFSSTGAFRIEAKLTADHLVVTFRGTSNQSRTMPVAISSRVSRANSPSNCESCGQTSCFRNGRRTENRFASGRTAYLVDEYWPEYDRYIAANTTDADIIGVPMDGSRMGRSNYAWDTSSFGTVHTATITTLKRSLALRRIPAGQAGARQKVRLKYDEMLAKSLASALTYDVRHVVVSQNLLPFLWRDGHLGGRTFDVLMTRLPIDILQDRLDLVSLLHPESTTARQFRADDWIAESESAALAAARTVVTPNSEIAAIFPERSVRIPWVVPSYDKEPALGSGILFPAPALARKGAYELWDAAKELGINLIVTGPNLEGPEFWKEVRTKPASKDSLDGIGLVVLPAYVEDKPRLLLRALSRGIPVIASETCGLTGMPGVTVIPRIDSDSLVEALQSQVVGRAKYAAINRASGGWPKYLLV